MDINSALWASKTGGHKKLISLICCLAVVLPAILVLVFCMPSNETTKLIMIIIVAVLLVAVVAVVVLGAVTSLKWEVSNLIFFVDENGLYFTGTVNQDSYFFAEWGEIQGYSIKPAKNNRATVSVFFKDRAECGSFGNNKVIKMVNVADTDKLLPLFDRFSIPAIAK